jgi:hypothetical protein
LQGYSVYAQFEMIPRDLDTFIASTRIRREELVSQMPPSIYSVRLQTPAANMDSYLFGSHDEHELLQEILIDVSNPDLYIVYINVAGG